jgi:hypothetical protein
MLIPVVLLDDGTSKSPSTKLIVSVPPLEEETFTEAKSMRGSEALPKIGFVSPVETLRIQEPTEPMYVIAPEKILKSPAPPSVTVTVVTPSESFKTGTIGAASTGDIGIAIIVTKSRAVAKPQFRRVFIFFSPHALNSVLCLLFSF